MKNLQKSFLFTLFLSLTLAGCIGQKGEKKADCSAGQNFDQRSRTCVGAQKPPSPLLDDITIFEDMGAQEITLTYSDPNGSEATTCKINYTGSEVWLRAKAWDTAALRASQGHNVGFVSASAIDAILHPVERASAFVQEGIALAAKLDAAAARTNAQMAQSLRSVASALQIIGNIAVGIVGNPLTQQKGADALTESNNLFALATSIDNMCSCYGGICKTVAVPDKHYFGVKGFSYSISDSAGTSPTEQVTLVVQSNNDPPQPQSQDVSVFESTSSTASPIAFTVNAARDIEDDIFSSFFTYTITNGTNFGSFIQLPSGKVSDCMGIGVSAVTDRTCTYTPDSGDTFGMGTQSAAFNFQGIDWIAKATGTWGDGITVTFVEHPISRMGGVNGVNGEQTVDIDVVGKAITVMIESDPEVVGIDNYDAHTVLNVITAIQANTYASALVSVVKNVAANNGDPVSTGSVTFGAGVDPMDTILYKVNDGLGDSVWSGAVSINVDPEDDFPALTLPASITITEDTLTPITLLYTDAEAEVAANAAAGCDAQTFGGSIQQRTDCLCAAGVCTVSVVTLPHITTSGSFEYNISETTGVGEADRVTAFTNPDIVVNVTAVNDPPFIAPVETVANESATAFPADVNFSLPTAIDVDGNTMTYQLKTLPTKGTLSGCVPSNTVGATISIASTCTYKPNNGNDNGNGSISTSGGAVSGITYSARFNGVQGNLIQISITQTFGVAPGSAVLYYDQETTPGTMIVSALVAPAGGTNSTQLSAAINSHPYLGQFLLATNTTPGTPQVTVGSFNLATGTDPMDFFDYEVVDNSGAGNNTSLFLGRQHIVMNPTNDFPTVCDYSKFNDAPECGLLGCIGNTLPVGNLVPSKEGISFYHQASAVCYKSKNLDASGPLTNADWEIVDTYIADQTVNEMEKIVIDGVRADEGGGDNSEDVQGLIMDLNTVTSSDPVLVPVANITFYHNGIQIADDFQFSVGTSADLAEFKVEIVPAANQTGTTTITFEIDDFNGAANGNIRTVSFNVTVNPVSIKHNGWKNISAVGPSVDPVGKIIDMGKVCNYSRTKCSNGECKGSVDPVNVITPDKKFAIFYNTLSKQCFYADGTTSDDWKSLDSYCNISPVEYAANCDTGSTEGSCIGDEDPRSGGSLTIVPTGENQFFYDKTNNVCYRSRAGASFGPATYEVDDWEVYKATAAVTLEWEDFTVFGSGVLSGFNIYRRLPGEEFDYDSPINKAVVGVSTSKFVDNVANSWYAPVPKTVYYYDVRPVVNGISTGVSEDYQNFNIVRLIAPDQNFAFVHRWIVNKSVCQMMNSTTIDPDNNFRCIYLGPGSTEIGSFDYYDIDQDMLVDRFEAGCNFNRAPDCSTPTGDCASNIAPNGAIFGPLNAFFYDRSTGTCYRNTNGANAWSAVTAAAADYNNNDHQLAQNPPLVNLTQTQANTYCDGTGSNYHGAVKGYTATLDRKLPSKKEQIAYSLWDDSLNTDTQISILETGLSINSSSKCNSSSASGLENGYSDTAMTNSNTMYSLPGTLSSGIRSVITGSLETKLCVSRFGAQDHVGNVAEYTVERIDCDTGSIGLSTCESFAGVDGTDNLQIYTNNGTPTYDRFRINSTLGPCRDTDSDGQCDSFIDKWILDEERYSAGRFIVPLGLPAHVNYPSTNPGDFLTEYPFDPGSGTVLYNFLFEIGPSSGVLSDRLHDDIFAPNTHHLFATKTDAGEGAMTAGGSFLSGSGAGLWTTEFIPAGNDATGFITIGDVSIKNDGIDTNLSIEIVDSAVGGPDCPLFIPFGIALDCVNAGSGLFRACILPGTTTANQLRDIINNDINCNGTLTAVTSGVAGNFQTTTTAPVNMVNFNPKNNRNNVGFRCVYPVPAASYVP